MKSLRSALAGVAALVAVSLLATACDTSPYAAKVNSQVIRQTELNAELREWAGNTAYVSAFDNGEYLHRESRSAGDAPGTYSTTWVAGILDGMVAASVVRQRLATTEQRPSHGDRGRGPIGQRDQSGRLVELHARVPAGPGGPVRRRGDPHPDLGARKPPC